jgi:hypothetical protein
LRTLFSIFFLSAISFYSLAKDCVNCQANSLIDHTPNLSETSSKLKTRLELSDCKSLDKYSCLYQKSDVAYQNDAIVIYHRGFWGKHQGNVPIDLRQKSVEQALSFYDLGKSSEKLQKTMLISTSSNVGFTVKEIESAIRGVRLKENAKVILVSHSGGYLGLLKTLKYLKKDSYKFKIEKIVMLDNFYFNSSSSSIFKEYFDKGVKCTGFFTEHNSKRLKSRLLKSVGPGVCSIEKRRGHNKSVNQCLVGYVNGTKCE